MKPFTLDLLLVGFAAFWAWKKTQEEPVTTNAGTTVSLSDRVREGMIDPWNPGAGMADGGMGRHQRGLRGLDAPLSVTTPPTSLSWEPVPGTTPRGHWANRRLAPGSKPPSGYGWVYIDGQPVPGPSPTFGSRSGFPPNPGSIVGGGVVLFALRMFNIDGRGRVLLPPNWRTARRALA